jgi:hypothetical protein
MGYSPRPDMGAVRRALALVPALTVACVACVACVAQPAPAPAPVVQQPPAADSTLGTLSLIDDRMRRAWPDNPDGPAWFSGAGYRLYARTPGEFVALRAPTVGPVDDVVVSATFRKIGGPPGGGYGVIVRDQGVSAGNGVDQSGQFLVAAIGDRGDFGVWRRDGRQWIDLVPRTMSTSVREGGSPNELTVQVLAEQLRFDVNGTRVADVAVRLQGGRVGIFVGGDENQVLIDRLTVQPLPSARQTDLRGKEEDVRAARATIARLSTEARQTTQPTTDEAERWQSEVAGVLSVVQELGRDLSEHDPSPGSKRVPDAHVVDDLVDLEHDIVAILEVYREGFDSPHSPLNDPRVLADAATRLDTAGHKAERIVSEVDALRKAYESTREAGGAQNR